MINESGAPFAFKLKHLLHGMIACEVLLGLIVVSGWHTGNARLVQVLPQFVPMQYNTALGFVLTGAGLLALLHHWRKLASIFGLLVSTIGLATLLQYASGVNLGLDELFMEHSITVQTSHPGRMAPNTALCFSLTGLLLLLEGAHRHLRHYEFRYWLTGAGVTSLGAIALIGYFTGVSTAYGWGQMTRMALHTSIGFMLDGLALVGIAWLMAPPKSRTRRQLITTLVAVFGLGIALFNYQLMHHLSTEKDKHRWQNRVTTLADEARISVAAWATALERLAWRRSAWQAPQQQRLDAESYLRDIPELRGLGLLTASGGYRPLVPGAQVDALPPQPQWAGQPHTRLYWLPPYLWVTVAVPNGHERPDLIVGQFALQDMLDQWLAASEQAEDASRLILHKPSQSFREWLPPQLHLADPLRFQHTLAYREFHLRLTLLPSLPGAAPVEARTLLVLATSAVLALILALAVHWFLRNRMLETRLFQYDNSPDMYVSVDPHDASIKDCNQTLADKCGYSKDEIIDRPVFFLYHPDCISEAEKAFKSFVETGRVVNAELELKRKDGTKIPALLNVEAVRDADGKILYSNSSWRDISEIKQLQKELAEANKELEKKVRARTRELEIKNRELEEFSYIASHDLQEPLRTVKSFAEFLGQDLGESLSPQVAKDLRFITEGTARMQRLIDDLLEYSRAGRKAIKLQPVLLDECLARVQENLAGLISESGARIVVDSMPVVRGDLTVLERIFQNLLHNAIKFRGAQPPEISISARDGGATDQVIIRVKDNGIGIEPRFHEQIFGPFKRLHGMDEYPGTGIGLAVVKKLVDYLGGHIGVESALDQGSVFWLQLVKATHPITHASSVRPTEEAPTPVASLTQGE